MALAPEQVRDRAGVPERLGRAGTRVKQLAVTFKMSNATIYNWLKQDRIDRGEAEGATTSQQLELAAAKRRIRQLETELAVARKFNEVFPSGGDRPKRLYPVIESLTGQGIKRSRSRLAQIPERTLTR